MSQLDLTDVPEHKRPTVIMDHLMRIQEDTILDRQMASQISISRRLKSSQDDYIAMENIGERYRTASKVTDKRS